jgi:nucleotide-binding universal stress UspA family protein
MSEFAPKTILTATDFSEHSGEGLRLASDLAGMFGARLVVLHAHLFEPPLYFTDFQKRELADQINRSKESIREQLARHFRETAGASVPRELRLVEAAPDRAILSMAEKEGADLIVMGSHGRSGWNRLMMGSVAERVMHESGVPVLIVRGMYKGIRRILCPVDFAGPALSALDHSVALAQRLPAELTVLHVTKGEESDEREKERLCEWIPERFRSGCRLTEAVRHGNADEEIVRAARSLSADLVVLGIEHKTFFDTTVIGTTAVRIIRHSPSPVLVVPRMSQVSADAG